MRWDDLRVFLALQRRGTISAAADELDVSRSTINRRLDALETAAGVRLVERGEAGIVLTDAGAALLPVAQRVENDALAAERLLAGRDFRISGRLDVTVFEVAAPLMAPAFAELRKTHPEIELHVAVSNRSLSLRRREADLAIRATDQPAGDLFGRKVGRLAYGVYGLPDQVSRDNPPWILWEPAMGAEQTWDLARRLGRPLRVAALVDSAELMLQLTIAGAGVALLPVASARRHPELVPLGPVPVPGAGIGVWILTHPDLRRSPRVRAAMSALAARAPELLAADSQAPAARGPG